MWALKRRHIHIHPFEENIVNGKINMKKWESESLPKVVDALEAIQEGETKDASKHMKKQFKDVNEYISAVFTVTGELAKKNWEQHKAGEKVQPAVGRFYVRYYSRMGNWRYAMKNVAF